MPIVATAVPNRPPIGWPASFTRPLRPAERVARDDGDADRDDRHHGGLHADGEAGDDVRRGAGLARLRDAEDTGRMFNVGIIIAGVALVFLAIGALTQALLEFELQSFFGRRRMEREIGRLSGHYIICGAGRVGRSAARELVRKPVPFVILEQNEAKAQRFANEDWLMHVGDATQEQTLRDVRIDRAQGLVAATTTDATNLYIVLTARSLNPALKIIARASEEDAEKHLLKAGADSVVHLTRSRGRELRSHFFALMW